MRTIQVVVAFDVHKTGDHLEVEDQVACDAIAQGYAVPSVYAVEPAAPPVDAEPVTVPAELVEQGEALAFEPATETRVIDGAPEVK